MLLKAIHTNITYSSCAKYKFSEKLIDSYISDILNSYNQVVTNNKLNYFANYDFYVDIFFVSDEYIKEINQKWRNQNKPTNVLSFEILHDPDNVILNDVMNAMGDIVISIDTMQYEASQKGYSIEQYCFILLLHGLLHLWGYDHICENSLEEMRDIESKIIAVSEHYKLEGLTCY